GVAAPSRSETRENASVGRDDSRLAKTSAQRLSYGRQRGVRGGRIQCEVCGQLTCTKTGDVPPYKSRAGNRPCIGSPDATMSTKPDMRQGIAPSPKRGTTKVRARPESSPKSRDRLTPAQRRERAAERKRRERIEMAMLEL